VADLKGVFKFDIFSLMKKQIQFSLPSLRQILSTLHQKKNSDFVTEQKKFSFAQTNHSFLHLSREK
jgi:hypothetical protein